MVKICPMCKHVMTIKNKKYKCSFCGNTEPITDEKVEVKII